jgi:hypothetical protein
VVIWLKVCLDDPVRAALQRLPQHAKFLLGAKKVQFEVVQNNVCKVEGSSCDGRCSEIAENALRDMFRRQAIVSQDGWHRMSSAAAQPHSP